MEFENRRTEAQQTMINYVHTNSERVTGMYYSHEGVRNGAVGGSVDGLHHNLLHLGSRTAPTGTSDRPLSRTQIYGASQHESTGTLSRENSMSRPTVPVNLCWP